MFLYACNKCEKYYVFADEAEECPAGEKHTLEKVTEDSNHYHLTTCAYPKCEKVLHQALSFDKNGKCEYCNRKSGTSLSDLVDADGEVTAEEIKALVYEPPTEETGSHAARALEDAVKKAGGFTSSHHKNRKGHHSANASATHDRGDRENANVRAKKKELIARLITRLENSAEYAKNPREYDKLIKQAESML